MASRKDTGRNPTGREWGEADRLANASPSERRPSQVHGRCSFRSLREIIRLRPHCDEVDPDLPGRNARTCARGSNGSCGHCAHLRSNAPEARELSAPTVVFAGCWIVLLRPFFWSRVGRYSDRGNLYRRRSAFLAALTSIVVAPVAYLLFQGASVVCSARRAWGQRARFPVSPVSIGRRGPRLRNWLRTHPRAGLKEITTSAQRATASE